MRCPRTSSRALIFGSTWALWCKHCQREIVVDVIRLLERHDLYDLISFQRAKCKACEGHLKQAGGYKLRSLQHRGRMARLVTSDGSNFCRPVFKGLGGRPTSVGAFVRPKRESR